jgi:nicotinamidase-related amidase
VPKTALIVIDMLNAYDHDDAERLTRSVEEVLPNIRSLIERARAEDVPVVYVNDNFGSWTSDSGNVVQTALDGRYRHVVEPIAPAEDDMFVVKARHSAFFQTPLEYLLSQEDVDRIVLTGQVTEQCILYSALDAYIRHLQVVVPRDAVACIHEDLASAALQMMERNMDAEVVTAADVDLG